MHVNRKGLTACDSGGGKCVVFAMAAMFVITQRPKWKSRPAREKYGDGATGERGDHSHAE